MSKLWGKNKVKVDIASYMHYIRGEKKVGKTTLFYELVKHIGKGDTSKGLLISVGDEDGYKALDDLIVAKAESWDDFIEIVDELINDRKGNDFKFIAIDTVDELVKIATKEVMDLHKRKNGKKAESLNAALGGYGAGRAKVKELIGDEVARLKSAYGLFCIGHTKIRDITEKGAGEAYQQLTTSLNFDYDSIFADKADIIATVSVEKNIVDVEEFELGKGKTKKVGQLGGVTRWIHLRDDGYNVDCGARFGKIVDKVELSAANYVEAIEEAIKKASNKTDDELKTEAEIEEKSKIEEVVSKAKELSEVNSVLNLELVEEIKVKFPNATEEVKVEVKKIMEEYEIINFKPEVIEEVKTEGLEKIVELLK